MKNFGYTLFWAMVLIPPIALIFSVCVHLLDLWSN